MVNSSIKDEVMNTEILVNCSKEQFIEKLNYLLPQYKSGWYNFKLKSLKDYLIIKPSYKLRIGGGSFTYCKVKIQIIDNGVIKVGFFNRLDFLGIFFISFFILAFLKTIMTGEMYFSFEYIGISFLIVAVLSWLFLPDIFACKNIVNYIIKRVS